MSECYGDCMVQFDAQKIRRQAKRDYEKTWIDTAELLHRTGKSFEMAPKGRSHPLFDFIVDIRTVLLSLGFEEIILPTMVDCKEVLRQYGPEGNVILDRVFYLAGLPRPDIGIPKETVQLLMNAVPGFDRMESLKNILRRYKKGEVEADNLIETMVTQLGVSEQEATRIINVFPEFRRMKPLPTSLTLRSHTTSLWFPVLKQVKDRQPLPIQLFSIGQKFRREQRLDSTHLFESWTASIVIMAEDIGLEEGQRLVKSIFEHLRHPQVEFRIKKATSKYYAPQTEFEAFVTQPRTGEYIEVGDGGFYSPVSLAQYDIRYPVFNFGFGLERMVMIEKAIHDIRKLVYPYLYTEVEFSDTEIAQNVQINKKPQAGNFLIGRIAQAAQTHANAPSPCQVSVYEGEFLGKRIVVKMVEREEGKKLLGAAAFNPIVVKDSSIIGAMPGRIPEGSVRTEYTYMDGIANLVVHGIERAIEEGEGQLKIRIGIVKRLSDANFAISESVRRYIESKNAKIDIRGPVFAEFHVQIFDAR